MPCLRTVGGFPYKTPTGGWLLRHVSIPHEESLPRMTSFVPHEESPPRTTNFRPARGVSSSPLTTCSFARVLSVSNRGEDCTRRSERGDRGPHEHGAIPTPGLLRNNAWGASSPRHANSPASSTRGRPLLTRAVMRHYSVVRPPTCRPVRLCDTPTPSEALEYPYN
jgi:hypothetical protein